MTYLLVAAALLAAPANNALVVSGGISLGSYQAGATYALIRYLYDEKMNSTLRIATGASAGNINAFLATMAYCGTDSPAIGTPGSPAYVPANRLLPDDNLFFNTWTNIGLERLSPAPDALGKWHYRADDALLSRLALESVEEPLRDLAAKGSFQDGCDVNLGITLTRVAPVLLGHEDAQIQSSRVVVPFHSRVSLGKLVFTNQETEWDQSHRSIGLRIMMPVADDYSISFQDSLLPLVIASSAFPVAFAAKQLDVCERADQIPATNAFHDDDRPLESNVSCLQSIWSQYRPHKVTYNDGGFFDNVPLGLAGALAVADDQIQAAPVRYWYINSDIRRPSRPDVSETIGGDGPTFLLNWIGRGIDEARRYELQSLKRHAPARFGFDSDCADADNPCFQIIDRYAPVVGDYFISFGAFVNRAFRIYDYYAGVYDGIVTLAHLTHPGPPTPEEFTALYRKTMHPPGLGQADPVGEYIVQQLASRELGPCFIEDLHAPADTASHSLPATVMQTLLAIEDTRQRLELSGNEDARRQFNDRYDTSPAGFIHFLDLLGERVRSGEVQAQSPEEQADVASFPGLRTRLELGDFLATEGNALVRRFMEVEKRDRGLDNQLRNPCVFGSVSLCYQDLLPEDLLLGSQPGEAARFELGWQTSLFLGHGFYLRPRYARNLARESGSDPSDRLGLAAGFAPAGFHSSGFDVGMVAYRFPDHAISSFNDALGFEITAETLIGRFSLQHYLAGNDEHGNRLAGRSIISLGVKGLNVPFGWFFRNEDTAEKSDVDLSWETEYLASFATLLIPKVTDRPDVRWDSFGFRGSSNKHYILAGYPGGALGALGCLASGGMHLIALAVPSYLAYDFANSSLSAGYKPFRANFPQRFFLDVTAEGRYFLYNNQQSSSSPTGPTMQAGGALAAGYDPEGRLVDDLRVGPVVSHEWDNTAGSNGTHVGLEASVLLLGGFLRLGVQLPKLFYGEQSIPSSQRSGTDTMAIELGFGDLDGLASWLLRWGLLPLTSSEGRGDVQ